MKRSKIQAARLVPSISAENSVYYGRAAAEAGCLAMAGLPCRSLRPAQLSIAVPSAGEEMTTVRVLVVEDDEEQIEWLRDKLGRAFEVLDFEAITSESDFRANFGTIAASRPDAIILDVMLRWTKAGRGVTPRPAEEESFYYAGLRCKKMLAENEETKDIPVIVSSVLSGHELPSGITLLPKEGDETRLVDLLRTLVETAARQRESIRRHD